MGNKTNFRYLHARERKDTSDMKLYITVYYIALCKYCE